jgi:hypothetical protein
MVQAKLNAFSKRETKLSAAIQPEGQEVNETSHLLKGSSKSSIKSSDKRTLIQKEGMEQV